MAALFEEARIPMLVIKGVPLSLQTTASLTAGGGAILICWWTHNR